MPEIGFINEKGERCFYTQSQGSLKVGPNDKLKELEEWAEEMVKYLKEELHEKQTKYCGNGSLHVTSQLEVYERVLAKIQELRKNGE